MPARVWCLTMKLAQPSGDAAQIPYELQSIIPVTAPGDAEGTWFRYVIAQGANEIIGMRVGSAEEVETAVREMVDHLNERSKGKNVKKSKPAPSAVAVANPSQEQL